MLIVESLHLGFELAPIVGKRLQRQLGVELRVRKLFERFFQRLYPFDDSAMNKRFIVGLFLIIARGKRQARGLPCQVRGLKEVRWRRCVVRTAKV